MMNENCDKHIKKAKYGIFLFLIAILIGILKKTNILNNLIGSSYDSYFIGIIVIITISTIFLVMPYINCLAKYNKKL